MKILAKEQMQENADHLLDGKKIEASKKWAAPIRDSPFLHNLIYPIF